MVPRLIPFCSAFILDERYDSRLFIVDPLRSYALLPIHGGARKLIPSFYPYFQSPKILRRAQPQNDKVEAIVAETLYTERRGRPAENFALLNKIREFSRII